MKDSKPLNNLPDMLGEFVIMFLKLWKRPLIEIYHGVKNNTVPWSLVVIWGVLATWLNHYKFDYLIFKLFRMEIIYPTNFLLFKIYQLQLVAGGLLLWGLRQSIIWQRLCNRINPILSSANLISQYGKRPYPAFDRLYKDSSRILRIKSQLTPFKKYLDARAFFETGLGIYIDEINEDRINGFVDIIYTKVPMPKFVSGDPVFTLSPCEFFVGQSKSAEVRGSFRKTPHLLVAGETGGGKSTFLKQLVAGIIHAMPKAEISIIDLKGGLDFHFFQDLKGVEVIGSLSEACRIVKEISSKVDVRVELLKKLKAKDIEDYNKLDAKLKSETNSPIKLQRSFIIIDEAAEVFLPSGSGGKTKEVQSLRVILSKVARQGRALGVHLIVATQRPDVKALDPQIKANLTGTLCFHVENLPSSLTILGNDKATRIAKTPGRAIWKTGMETVDIQTPYLKDELIQSIIEKRKKDQGKDTAKNLESVSGYPADKSKTIEEQKGGAPGGFK